MIIRVEGDNLQTAGIVLRLDRNEFAVIALGVLLVERLTPAYGKWPVPYRKAVVKLARTMVDYIVSAID